MAPASNDTIIRQLGPVVAVRPPSAGSSGKGSPPAARGPYPSPVASSTEGNDRECSRPHVHVDGDPPNLADKCVTAFRNSATITAGALPGPRPEGPRKAGFDGSFSVHASRSSSSGACPGPTASPLTSRPTGTLPAFHQGSNTAVR